MSIQQQMVEQLYSLADKAQQPDQIKALQQQITRSIQNGAVPSYAAIPLVQELTDRLQKAQFMQQAPAMQAQGIQQPPIAEQVLAQAQGLDNMPSNLPTGEQAYAAGGIVAFAGGDLVDDDEIETEDDRQESALMSLMSAARSKIQNLRASLPQSYNATLAAQKTASTSPAAPTEGGLSGILSSVASKYGVPAALLTRVSGAESSGNANAANPRSSAKGLFQFTDATWKGMGGKEGEQFNPEINADLGAKYIRQNAEHLKSALGRDPTYHEVYAAHMFGPGVSKMLNKANPKDPIERGLALFQSPTMVRKIMQSNPNLRGKSVSQVLDTLENKTGTGIVPLAQGGAIKHFQVGGEPTEEEIEAAKKPYIGYRTGKKPSDAAKGNRSLIDILLPPTYPIDTPIAATEADRKRQEQMEYQDLIEGPAGRNLTRPQVKSYETKEQMGPPVITPPVISATPSSPQASITEAVDPYLEKYMGMLQKRETDAEKQKELDTYLSVIQAGLGMMGGSSPYAMQNIGAGGSQGVAAYAAAQKQRAAEDAATLSGYGKLYTAKQASDLRRDLAAESKDTALLRLAQDKELKQAKLAQDEKLRIANDIRHLETQFATIAERNVKTALGTGFNDLEPQQRLDMIAAETRRLSSQSNNLKRLYKEAGLPDVDVEGPAAGPVPDYNKLYGLKPKK
jgi:hypothetical protein